MDKSIIRAAVVAVIAGVQAASGRPVPEITDATRPVGGIDGFDSLLAVEATAMLEQQLGCRLSNGVAFISQDGTKALSIAQTVDRVAEMIMTGDVA